MLSEVKKFLDEKVEDTKKENEKFSKLLSTYYITREKKVFDALYMITLKCCMATCKKMAGGLRRDLYEKAVDATSILMGRVQKKTKKGEDYQILHLPTCCRYVVMKVLYSEKQKMIDQEVSLEYLPADSFYLESYDEGVL